MDWYYALNGTQVGPVDDAQFDELIRAGTIQGSTLVWREGFEQWQILETVQRAVPQITLAPPPMPTPGQSVGLSKCAECQRPYPESEMVLLDRSWVCANCKPICVQRLKEGLPPVMGVAAGLWRSGKVLVIRRGTELPNRCVKCNEAATGRPLRRRLYWHTPALYLLIVVSLLIYVIVALVIRKRAEVHIGLCDIHRRKRGKTIAMGWLCFLAAILLFAAGFSNTNSGPFLVGSGVCLIASIVALVLAPQVSAKKIDAEYVWMRGCGKDFLQQFQEWDQP